MKSELRELISIAGSRTKFTRVWIGAGAFTFYVTLILYICKG